MKIIDTRNPVYEINTLPSVVDGELKNKTLVAIDIIINSECFTIKKKQKYIVKHTHSNW